MSASGSTSTQGSTVPANEGENGVEILESTTDAERVFDLGLETQSISIRADPGNAGIVFIGFTDDVDSDDGYPLEAGDAISIDLDVNEQPIFAIPNNANDELRFLAIS